MNDNLIICEAKEKKGMSSESLRLVEYYPKSFDVCPSWLRLKYREAVKFICQECNNHEDVVGKLEPHRIIRGNKGGKYKVLPLNHPDNNCKICCNSCHKKFHQNDNSKVGYK